MGATVPVPGQVKPGEQASQSMASSWPQVPRKVPEGQATGLGVPEGQ